jgi:hypothetical protein
MCCASCGWTSMAPDRVEEESVGGLSLTRYAEVYAATGEGFPLEAVLRHVGLDVDAWHEIDTAWAGRLMQSAEGEGELVAAYDAALLRAQDLLARPVPPLDTSLSAWLAFVRAWSLAEDPPATLAGLGLRPADVLRLHRLWSDRLAADAGLRAQAIALLEKPPGELPTVQPGQPRMTVSPGTSSSPPGPVPPPAPGRPALSVPLPVATPVPPRGASSVPPPEAAAPRSPPPPPDVRQTTVLTMTAYASMCAELEVFPGRREEILVKYGLAQPGAREAEDARWVQRMASDEAEREELAYARHHFVAHWMAIGPLMPRR